MGMDDFPPGTRVRLAHPSSFIKLRKDTGTVIRPDLWGDYVIVHLDEVCTYDNGITTEELEEVREMIDNLERVE